MKLVTLGAGAGSRLSSFTDKSLVKNSDIPKIVFPVMNKLMYQWSLLSYHHWLTLGEIQRKDLVFVLQDQHNKDFSISKTICDEFGNQVKFAFVKGLTKGPAETALAAMQFIKDDEDLIINDCDHHFSSLTFLSLIKTFKSKFPDSDFLLLPTTKVSSNIPTWSYVTKEPMETGIFSRVLEIKEKDPYLAGIGAPGVIGSYYFSSRLLFEKLFKLTFKEASGEFYISKMFELALREGIPIYSCDALFGFPLGTPDDIEYFVKEMGGQNLNYQGKTLFLDIDGVIIEHDKGYHSKLECYDYTKPLIEKNVSLLKHHFRLGDTIILTTTRPDKERAPLETFLSKNAIPYHQLIMGLNPGIRVLVNDRKGSEFSIDTAVAISIGRNKGIESFASYSSLGDNVIDNLTSGSGAETLRLQSRFGNSFIRKAVLDEDRYEREIEVLRLQTLWYSKVSQIIPSVVPDVIDFYQSDGLCLLDMEDLGNLPTMSHLISGNHVDARDLGSLIEDLLDKLGSLYSNSTTSVIAEPIYSRDLLFEIIHNKALPAINALFRVDHFSKWKFQHLDYLSINGVKIENPYNVLQSIVNTPSLFSRFQKGFSGNLKCLIHGDLTMENILVTSDFKVRLIDPLGAFMDPLAKNSNRNYLQRTTPVFDLVKLLQSIDAGYELWNKSHNVAHVSPDGDISWRDDLLPAPVVFRAKFLDFYSGLGLDIEEETLSFLLSLQLFRLIPYKLSSSLDKALFCLAAGSSFLQRSVK